MTARHLAGARILAQGLVGPPRSTDPAQAARAFGAHQGQDLPGVIASLALRTGGDLAGVLAAFDRGEVVRGYPMRGTVLAVAADSPAWLTPLCAGVPVDRGRGYHVLVELIAMGDAAYGPWREGETAVVHARRWLPAGSDLEGTFNGDRVAATAELALRYLTSHGRPVSATSPGGP